MMMQNNEPYIEKNGNVLIVSVRWVFLMFILLW